MEIQAAMGIAQLKKLPNFIRLRKKNFQVLYEVFNEYEECFILPTSLPKSDPCWFAFPLTVRREAPFKRRDIMQWLTKNLIEVKMLFTGNILVHPAYKEIKYRQSGALSNSDIVLNNSFFMGVYPGIDEEQMKYVLDVVRKFISKYR
jgi:CDP-6-deoxy-D-xylo-4-hexulose-3-dehydrase